MSQSRMNWTAEEDQIIKEIVIAQGQKKWTKIAAAIKERLGIHDKTGKQCRERWHNHLNPTITKDYWSPEEESKVFELQKRFGNKWSEIAAYMPGRTDNSIKNCFYSAIRRNLRKFNKKKPENQKLRGSLKSLLKKPAIRAVLMKSSFVNEGEKKEKREEIGSSGIGQTALGIFQFPLTPSTIPSLGSSKFCQDFFDFSEDLCGMYGQDSRRSTVSEANAPNFFVPSMTPEECFRFYFTPRNSNSNN